MAGAPCLVLGYPRGLTRSVLEALVKRGSPVVVACPDRREAEQEQHRLSSLYGPGRVTCCPTDPGGGGEAAMLRAMDTLGEVGLVVSGHAGPLRLDRAELAAPRHQVEQRLETRAANRDRAGLERAARLAVKYLGRQNGFRGGSLLHLAGGAELGGGAGPGRCSVLGLTRALGTEAAVRRHGVKVTTLYQPPALPARCSYGITDDQHSPYSREAAGCYARAYCGYMALHLADTAPPGTAWTFTPELKLQRVGPDQVPPCRLSNKMCYWLGCPMVCNIAGEVSDLRHQGAEQEAGQQQAVTELQPQS